MAWGVVAIVVVVISLLNLRRCLISMNMNLHKMFYKSSNQKKK